MSAARVARCVAAAAVVVTACSNSESAVNRRPHTGTASASQAANGQQITLDVGDDYRFHPSTIVVHPGLVTIVLKHTGTGAPHNFKVSKVPSDYVPQTNAGQTRSASFRTPEASKDPYQFICTFHVRQGQTGEMYVRP